MMSNASFRQYYSFVRPAQFIGLCALLFLALFQLHSAFTLAPRFFWPWFAAGCVGVVALTWCAWFMYRRRNTGRSSITAYSIALTFPQVVYEQLRVGLLHEAMSNMVIILSLLLVVLVILLVMQLRIDARRKSFLEEGKDTKP